MRRRRNEKVLRAVHPNAGLEAAYRRKLLALVAQMTRSYAYWIKAAYRANPPEMAMDALSSAELARILRKLGVRWERNLDAAAPKLAAYFAQSVHRQSEATLRRILKDAGLTVRFKMTPELRDIVRATVTESTSLIKSIASEYHTEVTGLVMRSVSAGRDLSGLSRELQNRYGITKRRAAAIALNQNNRATAVIQRERQTSVGLDEALWMHSHAGKTVRKTHLANDQRTFSLKLGWHDPDPKVNRRILPGELINCRCSWRPLVKGFS